MALLACNMGQLENLIPLTLGFMFGPPAVLLLGVILMRIPPAG